MLDSFDCVDVHKGDNIPVKCPVCEGKTWLAYARFSKLLVFVYCRNNWSCRWAELYRVV